MVIKYNIDDVVYYTDNYANVLEGATNIEYIDQSLNDVWTNLSTNPNDEAKKERATEVKNIKITTSYGNTFDGDELSQNRMVRALSVMKDSDLVTWKLANNTFVEVSKQELEEALFLAGKEQTKIWMRYQ